MSYVSTLPARTIDKVRQAIHARLVNLVGEDRLQIMAGQMSGVRTVNGTISTSCRMPVCQTLAPTERREGKTHTPSEVPVTTQSSILAMQKMHL
jgi:hypothetical protein